MIASVADAENVFQAYVSGSLGQAWFRSDREDLLLETSVNAEPRIATAQDTRIFFGSALELRPVAPDGRPVALQRVRDELTEARRNFLALDGLLVGMDPDFEMDMRLRAMRRADGLLAADVVLFNNTAARFLVPANSQEWDFTGAAAIAKREGLETVARLYEPLKLWIVDAVWDAVRSTVSTMRDGHVAALALVEQYKQSGLLRDLILAKATGNANFLRDLIFHRAKYPGLTEHDPNFRIAAKIAVMLAGPRPERETNPDAAIETPVVSAASHGDSVLAPVVTALQRFNDRVSAAEKDKEEKGQSLRRGGFADPEKEVATLRVQLERFDKLLKSGQHDAAIDTLATQIDRQSKTSNQEQIVKTLTQAAHFALMAKRPRLSLDISELILWFARGDVTSENVRAQSLRALGRHDEAIRVFEETVRCFPHNEVTQNARAETLRAMGRYDEALAAFEKTIRDFPHDEVAPTARAETLRAMGRYDEALAAFEKTMRDFPHNEVAPNARAETLRAMGRYDEALAAFEKTMRDFPHNEVTPNARAETLRAMGRYDEALAAFEKTMRDFPHNEVTPNARAETLRAMGRYDEALAAFEKTMRDFPHNEVASNARAETLRAMGRYDEALAAFEKTMRDFPHDEVASNARAETLRAMGRYDEALAAFEKTMRDFPHDEVASNARAETLRAMGRYDEALAAFEKIMRDFPHDEVASNARAETLRAMGRYDEALAALEKTMRDFPHDEVASNAHAETLRAMGRYDEALAAFEKTMRDFPHDEVAPTARAETLRAMGRHLEALAALKDTLRRFPHNAFVRNARLELLSFLGRYDDMDANLTQAPRVHSDWIARHILIMANVRRGRLVEAAAAAEASLTACPFPEQTAYFRTALALARLRDRKPDEALVVIKALERPETTRPMRASLHLFEAQCFGALGRISDADDAVLRCGTLLDKDDDVRPRLAWEIKQKFGLAAPMSEPPMPFPLLSEHDVLFELTARVFSQVGASAHRRLM